MATQQPTSTISYNTEPFLVEKLNAWYKSHIIQAYMYIKHKGEDGDKDHIHLRIIPNKRLDTMDLTEELAEYQIGKSKPLGCRPWQASKEEDWLLYCVHDEEYLRMKYGGFQPHEKLPYDWHEYIVSPLFDLESAWVRAVQYKKRTASAITSRLLDGERPMDLILQGENVFTINAVMRAVYQWDYPKLKKSLFDLENENRRLKDILIKNGIDFKV